MSRHVSNDLKRRARELADRERIPYGAALARLRSSRTPAETTAATPIEWLLPQYLYVDFPLPQLGDARPCGDCLGSGLDGRNFAQQSDGSMPPLLVEVICSTCFGCGRAEHDEENGCGIPHAEGDEDLVDEPDDWDEPECYSCAGREFNYLQGSTKDDQGEPVEVVYIRVPCGCTADRMRVITGDPVEVTA
ncbi:hypothetical protein [Streptomyces sp. NPDC005096]|uniref:hypothetical protein n=1 Tax=Streptomyces sp. NPDC005096 TaxID=3154559 RepID=UPI0033AA2E2F